MGFGALPPVDLASNSLGVAFVYANDQCFIFYYNRSDQKLYMAKGKEEAGYNGNAVAVGLQQDYITWNQEPEIRVYYIQSDYTVAEIITANFGNTWNYGSLTKSPYRVALVGGLAAYPGDLWRVIIHMNGQPGTFVELYEKAPGSWVPYVIP